VSGIFKNGVDVVYRVIAGPCIGLKDAIGNRGIEVKACVLVSWNVEALNHLQNFFGRDFFVGDKR